MRGLRYLLVILFAMIAMPAVAQELCPNCGRVKAQGWGMYATTATVQSTSTTQVIWARGPLGHVAAEEATLQAKRGRIGHIFGCPSGARFAGVGMSSSSPNAPTCEPRGPMELIGDAVVKGPRGYFRSRYWK
jgi:hypothetical protein